MAGGEFDPGQDGALWDDYTRDVHAALADAGANVADVTGALNVPGRSLRPADTHPNAAGHAAIGEDVAAALIASGALDTCKAAGDLAP